MTSCLASRIVSGDRSFFSRNLYCRVTVQSVSFQFVPSCALATFLYVNVSSFPFSFSRAASVNFVLYVSVYLTPLRPFGAFLDACFFHSSVILILYVPVLPSTFGLGCPQNHSSPLKSFPSVWIERYSTICIPSGISSSKIRSLSVSNTAFSGLMITVHVYVSSDSLCTTFLDIDHSDKT